MLCSLSICGVYDLRTLSFLKNQGIQYLSFDLRPRSLNFIQEYRLLEILKDQVGFILILRFENEKDFIIKKILEAVKATYEGEILLHFSGEEETIFCDQFNCPYLKTLRRLEEFEGPGVFQKGIVFPYFSFEDKFHSPSFEQDVAKFYSKLGKRSLDFLQVLEGDWDSNFAPSVSNLLDLDILQFSINDKVETCFRNVDLNKVESALKVLPNSF